MPRKSQAKPSPDARLDKYRTKRDFRKTTEPSDAATGSGGLSFVIQEHQARSHHFDFRLEMDGVLVSWAVPKGIPQETSSKRLAVHVEDHPLSYGSFEGEIPKGSYGAGQVAIWDQGEWIPEGKDWEKSFAKGKLKFGLSGKRLNGNYLLARMGEEPNWLLRRLSDSAPDAHADVLEESPTFIEPQLARVVTSVPSGVDWRHEIKLDGYRIIAVKKDGVVKLHTRNGHDWTDRFGDLAAELSTRISGDFVIDGEAVVFDGKGRTDFGGLQEALKSSSSEIIFVAFDLLHLEGKNLRELPLSERASRLSTLVSEDGGRVRLSHVWPASAGKDLFRQACRNGLEGIVSKKWSGRYRPGSRNDWMKSKCRARQEFLICGFTRPKGTRSGFGALLLGSHENGKTVSRGKVGTGFSESGIDALRKRFEEIRQTLPLFPTDEKDVTWLRPVLVAEVEFAELTRDGAIRQGSFLGLREDKSPASIHLETLAPTENGVVSGHRISHPDRIVFPADGITKIEVARYYEKVAEFMMPYVADRPLAILRAPEGIAGDTFFQKSFPKHLPKGVKQSKLGDGSTVFSISKPADLAALAQYGAIEFHPWGSTLGKPDIAEFLTWDLDPDPLVEWNEVLGAAFLLRDFLNGMGLEPMVKTSGGKGLHVMLRIRRTHEWDAMKLFTKDVSSAVAAFNPDRFIITSTKVKRKGKIFIDWMRNARGSTCIAPWCVRARDGAKVSMPVSWEELPSVTFNGFSIHEPPSVPSEWISPKSQQITKAMLHHVANM